MLTEAAGLAFLAAISPTALLVAAVFLGAANPRRTVLMYLAGAIVMTAVIATVVFVVLRAGHLYKPQERHARYGLRLGLGLLLLLPAPSSCAAAGSRRTRPRPGEAEGPGPDLADDRPAGAEGSLHRRASWSTRPSLTFVAAVQTVATSKDSVAESVLALILVIAITLLFVWVPFVLYLLMPERTGRVLRAFNAWLRTHGHQILVGALVLGGVVLTIDGILGLTGSSLSAEPDLRGSSPGLLIRNG